MVVRLRLARFGKKRNPIYNIVVAQARTARDSKPMEVLGTYDPIPKVPLSSADEPEGYVPKKYKGIELDTSRTKYWLGVGAQPSDRVWRILNLIGLMEPKPGQPTGRIGEPGKRGGQRSENIEALMAERARLLSVGAGDAQSTHIAEPNPTATPIEELVPDNPQVADEVIDSPDPTPTQFLNRDDPEQRDRGGGDKDQDLSRRGGMFES